MTQQQTKIASGAGNPQAAIDDLTQTLRELIRQRPIALFDWPKHPNAGDHFIWLGAKVLFMNRLGCDVLYECSLRHLEMNSVTALPPETVLVMQGGGNFGDLYGHHHRLREAIIAAFPDRRIVIMPQTVHFANSERLQQSARRMTLHPDLHVMARDQDSLMTLRSQMGLSNCYLHIDSAFALQPIVTALLATMTAEPESDVVYLLRRDIEAAQTAVSAEGPTRYDWGQADDLTPFAVDPLNPKLIDLARDSFNGKYDAYSWRQFCAAVRLFSKGRRIVTDRLHGHILAIMMRKEHDFYDNNYGKNGAFYQTWTSTSPLVNFVKRIASVTSSDVESGRPAPNGQSQVQNPTTIALLAEFEQGVTLHQQGKLADAERIYQEILQQQPHHFGALHLLGVVALQTRRSERAIEFIEKAIAVDEYVAAAHNNLGRALLDRKRPEDALASCDKAIALEPDLAEAYYNRGNVLLDLKRPVDALASYDIAIALKPDFAEANNNRGKALLDLKRPVDALASFNKAIALKPDYAEAYDNRGIALRDLKRPEDAGLHD